MSVLGTIAGGLVARGATERVAKVAAPFVAAAAVFALLAALWGGWQVFDYFNDRAAVKQDRIEREAAEAAAALEAERRANAGEQSRTEARNAASNQTLDQLEAIEDDDPQAATAPAPRGSRAVADRLRD